MEAEGLVDIVALTEQHAFSGKLNFGERRLSEFLNDQRVATLVMHDVSVSRIENPAKVIAHHPLAALPKQRIAVVLEQQLKIVPLDKRLYHYVKKEGHDVVVVVDGLEVQGCVHTAGGLDLYHIFNTSPDFIPITQPTLSFRAGTRYVLRPDAVMVNTRHIQYLAQSDQQSADAKKARAEPQNESSA